MNDPTLLQSVFLQNDPLIRTRIAESGWIADIQAADDSSENLQLQPLITEAYLRCVSRLPTQQERSRAKHHLNGVDSIAEGLGSLLWALVNTKEFILQH